MKRQPRLSNLLNGGLLILLLTSGVALLLVSAPDVALAKDPPSNDLISSGTQCVDLLAKLDFAGTEGLFDSTMKSALPEEKLREVWQTLQQQAGPFKNRLRTRVENAGDYDLVFVTCEFAQANLDAKVVFDANKRISGLFFVPSQLEANSFAPPPYARTSAFQEKDSTVGSGEWSLPGTLTLPVGVKRPLAAVVLVHGSGPNDRDETILANKPFRDLAWGLATKGIAVPRLFSVRVFVYSPAPHPNAADS